MLNGTAKGRKEKEGMYVWMHADATEGLLEIHCPIWELFHVESADEPQRRFPRQPRVAERSSTFVIFSRQPTKRESGGVSRERKKMERERMFGQKETLRISIFGFRESRRIVFRVALYIHTYIYTYTAIFRYRPFYLRLLFFLSDSISGYSCL